jgi:hypothetical protein
MPGTPASASVGTLSRRVLRADESTASGRSLPPWMCGNAGATSASAKSTSLPATALVDSEAPLYGTCRASVPVADPRRRRLACGLDRHLARW